jgi:glucose-6-phosphate 1-dehydrogenase
MGTITTPSSIGAETATKVLRGRQPQSATLVIFGAGGDLTKRLVVPALYHLVQAGKLPEQFAIIGVDHNDRTTEQWCQRLTSMMQTLTPAGRIEPSWSWLTHRMHYMPADFTQSETFSRLDGLLAKQREQNSIANVLFYLAVGERFFGPIVEQLGHRD